MKRKLLIVLFGILIFAYAFATSAFATVNYDETAILSDGTRLPIYDEDNNPLIWYVSGVGENGKNIYSSIPNNCNEPSDGEDYVTYTINTSWMTQLENINFHVWSDDKSEYEVFTEEDLQVVVVNLRGITSFEYINNGFKVSDIQYIYFNEVLKDFCEYFQESQALRLVDLSVCTNLSGGFGGRRNLYNCTNLHTVRLAPGTEYSLACTQNYNWRFAGTAITELVIPANITSLGVDNFRNCGNLESLYILGNTTSLGERNFLGCTQLKSIYILGDNPEIEIDSFKKNFFECVDGNTTNNFTDIGQYFYFVSTNTEYLAKVKDAIGADAIITYEEFSNDSSKYEDGRYVISGANLCEVYYGEHADEKEVLSECASRCSVCGDVIVAHKDGNTTVDVAYTSFTQNGTKIISCKNDGCTYNVTTETPALFICRGYSVPENGDGGITIGYVVNYDAIENYKQATGKTLEYGVFAVLKDRLGSNDIFDAEGKASDGVISANLSTGKFSVFQLKIVGFKDEQKDVKLAMGAYVAVTENGETSYSYMQYGDVAEGEKYAFASYNDVLQIVSENNKAE